MFGYTYCPANGHLIFTSHKTLEGAKKSVFSVLTDSIFGESDSYRRNNKETPENLNELLHIIQTESVMKSMSAEDFIEKWRQYLISCGKPADLYNKIEPITVQTSVFRERNI